MEKLLIKDYLTTPLALLVAKITETKEDESYHQHDFYEIFYILEGNATHIVNDVKDSVEVGDIVLLRKSDCHMFKREKKQYCSHRDIVISEQQLIKSCEYISPGFFDYIISSPSCLKAKISRAKITELENHINDIFFAPLENSLTAKSALINIFAVDILSIFLSHSDQSDDKFFPWLNQLLLRFTIPTLINRGLPAILEKTNYNQSYVCRVFKKYLGCNMTQYLLNARLEYAASLLQITNNTNAQICETVGFESIPYFISSFKRKFDLTPGEFRQKQRTKPL